MLGPKEASSTKYITVTAGTFRENRYSLKGARISQKPSVLEDFSVTLGVFTIDVKSSSKSSE